MRDQLEAIGEQRLQHPLQWADCTRHVKRRQLTTGFGVDVVSITVDPGRPTDDLRVAHLVGHRDQIP
jgi:hypothetical protein